ncbi:GMC oxidoreductase [Periconia macrospinosa]|uniref:GMC oxidoreductase n=1 Tax=Periconia macrospinosa TaxID=97972 RepID=A0A2V1D8W5_9PLEO|nr:GMC oxidoreductase [Periconia macrospinosa]
MMEGRLMSRCRGLLEVREGFIAFLHQLAPDFLVQSEVITALDKEVQGHFNPHTSILAAHLNEIKNLSWQEIFQCSHRKEWLVRLEALFLLARKADEELGHVAHGLLDEFDSIFYSVFHEYVNHTIRACYRIIPYDQEDSYTFITICLQNGVLNYVSANLDAGESLYQSRDHVPILQFLVDPVFFREWSYDQTQVRKEGYTKVLEAYKLVLAHGVKPDEPYPSHWFPCTTSPWVRLIKYAVIGSQTMTDIERGELGPFLPCPLLVQSPFWLDVMDLFLGYGANPSARLPAWKDGSRKAIVVNPLAMLLMDESIATDKVKANNIRKRLISLGGVTEPYIMDKEGIMYGFFGNDWRKGVWLVQECKRRNTLIESPIRVLEKSAVTAATRSVVDDVVIVGGGTAGLTVAYEIATHTNLKVRVLEAGDDPTAQNPEIEVPINEFNVSINPKWEWGFVSAPQNHASNVTIPLARFKGLGGCSQHNGAGFWLGSQYTYDKWPKGFKYSDFHQAVLQEEGCVSFGPPNHGTTGPLHTILDPLDHIDPYLIAFKAAALQAGYRFNPDENAPLAKGYMPHVVTNKDGRRFGPYGMFKSVMGRLPNLRVDLNTTVTGLLYGGGIDKDSKNLKITGVTADHAGSGGVESNITYLARKAVVMAAGAYQTPQILMVSGIGDKDTLNNAGINPMLHLPGVGKNLKDHYALPYIINSLRIPPMNDPAFFATQAQLYATTHTGYFAWPSADHAVVSASTNGSQQEPLVPVDVVMATFPYTFFPGFNASQIFSLIAVTNPGSSGTVTVSSDSVYDPPVIDLNYFSNPHDFEVLYKGEKLLRQIFNQTGLSQWFGSELSPGGADNTTLKAQVFTADHPMGTCMIGQEHETFAVADYEAAVFGTRGLYIADASLIRTVDGATPNASIHATVILVAKIVANKLMCRFSSICL